MMMLLVGVGGMFCDESMTFFVYARVCVCVCVCTRLWNRKE